MSEQTIRIAAKLYEARAAAKFIIGDDDRYRQEMDTGARYLEELAKIRDKSVIEVGMEEVKNVMEADRGIAATILLACIVHSLEPEQGE